MPFLLRLVVTTMALWLTTLLVPGVTVVPFASDTMATVLTFVLAGLVFTVVNLTIGLVLRVLSLPLYILTLGLFSLIVNGALLMLAAGINGWFGFGLRVESFGWGVWGALVLGVISWLLGLLIRPGRS